MRAATFFLLAALPLTACTLPAEAPRNVVLTTGPGSPGFVVVGFAEQNYRWDFATWTQSISLTFTSPGHDPAVATRRGCGSFGGFMSPKPCDLSKIDRDVLQLAPGVWTLSDVAVAYHTATGDGVLRNKVVPPLAITIRPGEIVDAGNYVFASDAEKNETKLVAHGRDDMGTRYTLAVYPNLRATPVTYGGGP